MAKIIDIHNGFTTLVESTKSKFLKELKKIFRQLGISYSDPCCNDEFIAPVS